MPELRTPEVERYWRAFCQHSDFTADQRYDVFDFGDSPEMADELAALVVDGPKRATAGLLVDYEQEGELLPEVGIHSVVVDGRGDPACVLRTTQVELKPFSKVDAEFAWDEGEGDRSLESWLAGHRAYFSRDLARHGLRFSDDMLVVLERFELAWPAPAQVRLPEPYVHSPAHGRTSRRKPRLAASAKQRPKWATTSTAGPYLVATPVRSGERHVTR